MLIDTIVERLARDTRWLQTAWKQPQGTLTRHCVVDDLLPPETAQRIADAFPPDGAHFHQRSSFREHKRTSADLSRYAPILADITYAIQDQAVVACVADITGIASLEPDPLLYAGGLSMMFKGDFLNPHVDNSHDAKRERYRRLNLLYYVTPGWKLENGGNFELWDERRTAPKTLVSQFNRLVIMETTPTSWHSVSPVTADGPPRCCVSNYFFSQQSPTGETYFHVTSFDGRPGETLKHLVAGVDNALRNAVSKTLGIGRGKSLVNKNAPTQPR